MHQPSPKVIKDLASMVKQYSEVIEWLEEWHLRELKTLPYALNNPTLQQGRCQVLNEITRLFRESPNTAAKQ